jgi:hypothetical protein
MKNRDTADDVGKLRKFEHPGRGRVCARAVPKERKVDPRDRFSAPIRGKSSWCAGRTCPDRLSAGGHNVTDSFDVV